MDARNIERRELNILSRIVQLVGLNYKIMSFPSVFWPVTANVCHPHANKTARCHNPDDHSTKRVLNLYVVTPSPHFTDKNSFHETYVSLYVLTVNLPSTPSVLCIIVFS